MSDCGTPGRAREPATAPGTDVVLRALHNTAVGVAERALDDADPPRAVLPVYDDQAEPPRPANPAAARGAPKHTQKQKLKKRFI